MTVKRTMLQHQVIAPKKTVKVKAPLFNELDSFLGYGIPINRVQLMKRWDYLYCN